MGDCAEHGNLTKTGESEITDSHGHLWLVRESETPHSSLLKCGILDGRGGFRRLSGCRPEREPSVKSLRDFGFTKSADEVGRAFLPFCSWDRLLKNAAVLERPFPSGLGDGVFGANFIKYNLRPWAAARVQLLLAFDMHQIGESISGLKHAVIDLPSCSGNILQMKCA